ncbi:M23 family metallopeptidase [Cupriavidus campinensis]
MIISPPFLPALRRMPDGESRIDPMMDAVDEFELPHHGIYPIAFDRRWHGGVHLAPSMQNEPIRAIADGEVVAYRVTQKAIADGRKHDDGSDALNSNPGFVLLRHTTETGEGRTMTFYSLYMHLLDLDSIRRKFGPLPSALPDVGSSTVLPKWLAYPTEGVQVPQGRKVYRKDILGYAGACHGYRHLHFEIFMTEGDFKAWFEKPGHAVQIGIENPTTPASKDYWGHTYFVIPGGQQFAKTPPSLIPAQQAYFPALQDGTLDASSKLYVEAYFHKGQRYTRAWVEKDGAVTLLTPTPVRDACEGYEYNLYARATALYPRCPSDGYEMLRFGRILCDQPMLPEAARATWVAVTFEAGKQGYIDISNPRIQKLSDADFPFFIGWRKLDERTTPFDQDGLCDFDELRKIVAVVEDAGTPTEMAFPAHEQEGRLAAYVRNHAEVREKLRGFVCHAPSEWDASGNEARYRRLNDPDGFFG